MTIKYDAELLEAEQEVEQILAEGESNRPAGPLVYFGK